MESNLKETIQASMKEMMTQILENRTPPAREVGGKDE